MQYTNTRRAAMGAAMILILAFVIFVWRGRWPQTSADYALVGAAFALVALNLAMSYYFDLQRHRRDLKR